MIPRGELINLKKKRSAIPKEVAVSADHDFILLSAPGARGNVTSITITNFDHYGHYSSYYCDYRRFSSLTDLKASIHLKTALNRPQSPTAGQYRYTDMYARKTTLLHILIQIYSIKGINKLNFDKRTTKSNSGVVQYHLCDITDISTGLFSHLCIVSHHLFIIGHLYNIV